MICPPCKRAGKYNQAANESVAEADVGAHRATATYHHGRCEAPKTCPCQHVVGQVTGTEARLAG